MALVRLLKPVTGYINLRAWPEVGGTIDLPESIVDGMVEAGTVERVKSGKTEKRPASKADVEER